MVAKKIGRPSLYTEELAAEFCARLIEAKHGYREVVKADDMPAGSTFFLWLSKYPEFMTMYDAALELRAIAMNEESIEIADTPVLAMTTKVKDGKTEITTGDAVERSKLRVQTRQWAISHFNRQRFGNRSAMELTGPDGGPIEMDDGIAAAKLAALFEGAQRRKAEAEAEPQS